MASNADPFPLKSFLSTLLTSTQDLLGYERGEGVQFQVKPFWAKGAVILLPRNRKQLEEKLSELLPKTDDIAALECKLFNFSEKFRAELVTVLNQKLPQTYVHHFDILYDKKSCALLAQLQTDEVMSSCMEQLVYFEVNKQIGAGDKQIALINLGCVEDALTRQELLSLQKTPPAITTFETRETESACTVPTLERFRNGSLCLAVRNLMRLTASSVTLVDSFEWSLELERIREMTELIYQRCRDSGLLVGGGEGYRIVFEDKLNEQLECALTNHPKQHLRQVQLVTGEGEFSKEILLASLIVSILRNNDLQESERVVLFSRHKLRDLVFRSLHILYGIGLLKSRIDILTHSNCDSISDFTADLSSRRDYLHGALVERSEGEKRDLASKARALCENTTKFELLSLQGRHEVRLVTSDKLGSHHSMFLLYNYARIAQLLDKFQHLSAAGVYGHLPALNSIDFSLLELSTEWSLFVKYVLLFPDFLQQHSDAPQLNSISNICRFLICLSQDFSTYYSKTKILVQSGPHLYPRVYARVHLVTSLRRVMDICFRILEITPPHQL